ncbi:MAG: hypothetical protein BWY06_00142 [Candidatus Latescibacteria bacterium ADurb.Bin168]|nr:MAG: hypothetical protein BWY06_00142 [Candidatus Latescibacteria bacterium ADurb.Bin168]
MVPTGSAYRLPAETQFFTKDRGKIRVAAIRRNARAVGMNILGATPVCLLANSVDEGFMPGSSGLPGTGLQFRVRVA